jgi:hypothetical protein
VSEFIDPVFAKTSPKLGLKIRALEERGGDKMEAAKGMPYRLNGCGYELYCQLKVRDKGLVLNNMPLVLLLVFNPICSSTSYLIFFSLSSGT